MRTAIVLFNLGGPDSLDAVEPFLFNLFNDPAIIGVPGFVRPLLARLIARRRGPTAREIYAQLGGGSPLLANTREQAQALEAAIGDDKTRCFVCMRYWHPMSNQVVDEVAAYDPDLILLLPLYPQFSTTTTGSSFNDWYRSAKKANLTVPTRTICCYPTDRGFVEALASLTGEGIETAEAKSGGGPVRVLFSAHGLPQKIVDKGDPYAYQVERTAAAVADRLDLGARPSDGSAREWQVCFQSQVGPLKWIGPYTDAEIERAAAERRAVVLVPLAFVSEHSETLVELDIEYRALGDERGCPAYVRVPTVSANKAFIDGLAAVVARIGAEDAPAIMSETGGRYCPADLACCAQAG